MADPRETPAMQQYYRFKRAHPGCVLMFRIGDFYEMFDEDAVAVSRAIGLTLTARSEGMPMCGVPFHQLEVYLKKLLGAGFRVAVCEQLQDASQVKGIVPRGVTRVVTPGTAVDETLLEGEAVSALAAVLFTQSGEDSPAALAVIEVSTGEFVVSECSAGTLVDELARRGVRELLYAETGGGSPPARVQRVLTALGISGTARPGWQFRPGESLEALREQYGVKTLAGFGLRDDEPCVQAAGALVRYLKETQTLGEEEAKMVAAFTAVRATLRHIRPPRRDDASACCVVDAVSLRSLEVERTLRGGEGAAGSLLGVFLGAGGKGSCRTAMGKRLLREWLCRPLRDIAKIEERQRCVRALVEDASLSQRVGEALGDVQDIARIAGRVALGRATPRDMVGLATSLAAAARLVEVLEGSESLRGVREELAGGLVGAGGVGAEIARLCVENPPAHARDGGIFRDGIDAELDEARLLQRDAGAWLSAYQAELSEKHSLPGLKLGYNRVFGYYIELPAAQARSAPAELTRKQTLKNAERYTTPQLREFEGKVMNAEARALERERVLFGALCERVSGVLGALTSVGEGAARLDVLAAMADKAVRRGWRCPEVVEGTVLMIEGGRHPVLEETLASSFVPNDVGLGGDASAARMALITGPNMAGKSTFIRQTALIALLAHTGSFVPADRACIGVIDRIFTRIGADDALHAGQSTFMVEMIETANILNHATGRSLVVLDEVGRGTSTLDGLSLAWGIVEFLAGETGCGAPWGPGQGPRTLFATHYHELTDLEERLEGRVTNLHVAVREWPQGGEHAEIVFLHRILPGRTDQSYGLHVARLAGMPAAVVARGREVLGGLAVHHTGDVPPSRGESGQGVGQSVARAAPAEGQLGLFTEYVDHPAVGALREIKIEALTPLEAFDALRRLKGMTDDVAAR
jgi:DNA mismatch repair protein MutS